MPALLDTFFQSEALIYAIAAIGFLAGAHLLQLIFRRMFRRRIHVPGTANTGRLGLVKSSALDRRRRLLVVRRDDVEHLIVIGGPSDILVEPELFGTGDHGFYHDLYGIGEKQPGVKAKVTAHFGRIASSIHPAASRILVGPGLFPLAVLAGIGGAGAGLVVGFFRLALGIADRFRVSLPVRWHGEPLLGLSLLIIGAATAAAISAWLVRRFSEHAVGSGIPHVEAVINGELPPAPFILVPIKLIGGLLAIGSGFALGREGPSVQMGAKVTYLLGKTCGRNTADCRSLLAAGAGAGLAAAFNAPLAGSAFVLEELIRKFDIRDGVAALGASGSAIVVARLLTGPAPDFIVTKVPYPGVNDNLLCIGLGVVAGLLGVVYNRVVLGALGIADRLASWPVEIRAAIIGAVVGALAWFVPDLVGGGESLTQKTLDGAEAVTLLPFIYLFRLFLGAASYAAGTPGGLFAPLLVLGAQMGFVFGWLSTPATADPTSHAVSFALVGMAALFTAAVRAPLTGMILITEMTDNSRLLLPMLAACFSAMAVATMLREPPIYDALKERSFDQSRKKEVLQKSAAEPVHVKAH